MAVTVTTVIARVRRQFPAADDLTILEYMNEVHSNLLQRLPMVADSVDLTLVVGQAEYVIVETNLRVWSAHYYVSATDIRPLIATDKTEMDIRYPSWRSNQNSQPGRFYVDRNTTDIVVGLNPPPATATSGTYPFVRLYVTTEATLTTASSLPKGIASADTYVSGVMERFTMGDPKIHAYWSSVHEKHMQAEISKYHGMNVQKKPSIIPSWVPPGGHV